MQEQGYDCATLFGIQDYYNKFGYAACIPSSYLEVRTRDAEKAEAQLKVEPYRDELRPQIETIYHLENQLITGTIERTAKTEWFHKGSNYDQKAEAVVFLRDQRVMSYASCDLTDGNVSVAEVGAVLPSFYPDIVRWAAEKAIRQRNSTIQFILPTNSRFADHLSLYGAKANIEMHRCSDGMGRIINLKSFLQNTLPEWTRRCLKDSRLNSPFALKLVTDIGTETLSWDGDQMRIRDDSPSATLHLPQMRLMQLCMGYVEPYNQFYQPETHAEGKRELVEALFYKSIAHMWIGDHF